MPRNHSIRDATSTPVSRSVRLDRPGAGEPSPAGPETVGFLDRLLRSIRSTSPEERRATRRHSAGAPEVWVGWFRGEEFQAINGHLIDISRGGARVVLGVTPPRRAPVWIYKEVGDELSSARADLVGWTPADGGAVCARFRFAAPCPTLLVQAVVCAPTGAPQPPAARREGR